MERRKKIQSSHAKNISSEITSFHNMKKHVSILLTKFS